MGRKKMILEISNKPSDDESDDNSSDGGTDEELQEAFARGELKPGLSGLVALKPHEKHVNNKSGLTDKLNQIKLDYDWLERLDLVSIPANATPDLEQQYGDLSIKVNKKGEISGEELLNSDKSDHDFKREMLFYRQAQSTVLEAISKLRKLGIPTKRPDDYFAEMAKTDDHMKKVRENIVRRQTAMEASDKAKKLRELRKYGKKIQHEVMIKRQKEKREMMDKLKRFKKGRQENLDFLDNDNDRNRTNNKSKGKKQTTKINQKQKYKESKYGFGGQKKRSKYNTSSSSADMSKFSRKRNAKPSNKKQRPGKSKRQKMKSKRR